MVTKTAERSISFVETIKARHVDEFLRNGRGVINIKRLCDVFAEIVTECSFIDEKTEITSDVLYELPYLDFQFIMTQFGIHINGLTSKN